MSAPRTLALVNGAFEAAARGLRDLDVLDDAELLLVDAVAPRFGETDPEVLLGLALALRAPRAGHVGVDLLRVRERSAQERRHPSGPEADAAAEEHAWPAPAAAWERKVTGSRMVGEPADPQRPFVRQATSEGLLVMTRRMWREQERLAQAVASMLDAAPVPALSEQSVLQALQRLFPGQAPGAEGPHAVARAAAGRLTVITGGPGTGKTYSIKRLLALLLSAAPLPGAPPLRIELAAPTGKAAVRMAEAMAEKLGELDVPEAVRARLATLEPRTLHRLLGVRPDGSSRHTAAHPLPADVVVVDEASMVDLVMMRRLFEAIPAGARLILLGDRDQLASVEAGSVLADLVAAAQRSPAEAALSRAVVGFTQSRRFATAPTVAAIARALQEGSPASLERGAQLLLGSERVPDPLPERVRHLRAAPQGRPSQEQLAALAAPYCQAPAAAGDAGGYAWRLGELLRSHGAASAKLQERAVQREILDALEGYRVLATHRGGAAGVAGLLRELAARVQSHLLRQMAARAKHGDGADAALRLPASGPHWLGRPVLVTENSYDLNLMNGDVGVVLPGPEGLVAVFPHEVGGERTVRSVPLARLPPHTGALAMTVHKSQGSQFQHVGLVLADPSSPIQTRELVYTGITRSSARLSWLGSEEVLREALARRVQRASGLADLLAAGSNATP